MRVVLLVAAASAIGTVAFYVAWIVAAADDYDGGFRHIAAVAAGALDLASAAALVVSLGLIVARWHRPRR